MYLCVVLLGIAVSFVTGYPYFRDSLPNGKNVPHPCRPNYIWKGVGHKNILGGGVRNSFGKDFDANGRVWDECLCKTDSDGDGRTNGEELGDPDCVWKTGDVPFTKQGLSHPGICEPMDSDECQHKNDWEVDCSVPEFICDELNKTEDVQTIRLQLSPTPVPPKETTYICQGMELPSNDTYHMIASEPLIANENVMHHIVVFKCPKDKIDEAKAIYSDAAECDMAPFPCVQIIATWAVGVSGSCLLPDYGVPIGQGGAQYVILQVHWNNPELKDDYLDSSGVIFHYTSHLRDNDGGTITVGPTYLELHPGYSELKQEGICPATCTEHLFKENIYVAEIQPHMHYRGRKMVVELWRDRELNTTLLDETDYNYDNPHTYSFHPPIEIYPGDEITVSCTFETKSLDSYLFFGDATSDEMCSAIVTYYPEQNGANYCSMIENITYCGALAVAIDKAKQCIGERSEFLSSHFQAILSALQSKCDPKGADCWSGCEDVIQEIRDQHPCLEEDTDEVIKSAVIYSDQLPDEFVAMLVSCDEMPDDNDSTNDAKTDNDNIVSSLCTINSSSTMTGKAAAVFMTFLVAQLLWI